MPFLLETSDSFKKALRKLTSKNPEFRKAFENKLCQILDDPHRFKPLGNQLHGFRRVHLMGSFVLVYEIAESRNAVALVKIAHHDDAYKV